MIPSTARRLVDVTTRERARRHSARAFLGGSALLAVVIGVAVGGEAMAAAPLVDAIGAHIIDVRPTSWQLGDRVIVEGRAFDPSVTTQLRLDGEFTPPLSSPGPLVIPARVVGRGRLLIDVDSALRARIGVRRRFRGRVSVQQLVENVQLQGAGRVVELELFPSTLRGEAAELGAGAAAWWLGRGVLASGDVVVAVNGAPVDSNETLVHLARSAVRGVGSESNGNWAIELTVRNVNGAQRKVALSPERVPREEVDGLWMAGALILIGLVILLPIGPLAGMIVVAERKIAGRMQSRYGPNRVGPGGWLQWLADGIKLILKEDIIPTEADPWLFRLSPYLVFMGLFATFVVLPLSERLIVANLNIGVLYLASVTSLVVVGILMGGWASNSKWSLLGGMRSAAQIMSYELPASLALLTVVLLAGSLSPQEIVRAQGGFPWQWNLFHGPWTLAAFVIYFVSALAEGNRIPFDLPEAESELVSGYNTEYSGFRFSIYFLTEWTNLLVIGAVVTALFLGGWQIPGVSADRVAQSLLLQLVGAGIFLSKAASLVFVIIWIRWTLPRLRVDQMMNLCWKFFIPISLVSFVTLAGWLWLVPPLAQQLVQGALFVLVGLGGTAYFVQRVRYNLRTVGADLPTGGRP